MAWFEEIKQLSRNGGLVSEFKWSLIAIPVILIFSFVGVIIPIENESLSLFVIGIFENIGIFIIYLFALKRGIKKFGLKTYSLKVEYIAGITLLLVIYVNFLFAAFLPSSFKFSSISLLTVGLMFAVPCFVK